MRVFLTGGTGFVGGHLRRALVRQGHQVVALAHHPQPEEKGIHWVPGDIASVDSLADGMDGCQAVIHLVGIIQEHGEETFERVHVQGTEHVLAAMRRVRITRLLHMSALGASAKSTIPYFRTKWQAEEAVRATGIDFTIFRPSLIFGPGDGFISILVDQLRKFPVTPVIGRGDYRFSLISIHAVTAAYVQALSLNGATLKRAFELCGPETFTYNEILDLLGDYLHIHKRRVYLPVWMAHAATGVGQRLGIPLPATPDQIKMLLMGSTCKDDSAYEVFELPVIRLGEGIQEYLPG